MRLIDADRLKDILEYGILCNVPADAVNTKEEKWNDWVQKVVDKAPTVEAIPKADYEARLKADMVAMLEEIQLELDEMKITKVRSAGFAPYSKDPFRRGVNCSKEIIQDKINALKGE